MKKILLCAYDAAPSQCFERLNGVLHSDGLTHVTTFVGHGKPIATREEEVRRVVLSSDFVLIGMSSSPTFAEIEIKVGEWARSARIPYGFYSDVPLAVYRARRDAWFYDLAQTACLVVGLLPGDDISVMKDLFPIAKAIATGNPLREEMSFPGLTRHEARARLGISDSEYLIAAPGGKFAAGNCAVWMLLIEALEQTNLGEKTTLIITPHPGDTTLRAMDSATGRPLSIYEEIAIDSTIKTRILSKESATTSEVIAAADLVVEFTGSASVEAAYRRIPVISIIWEVWFNRFQKESGLRMIETVAMGASYPVNSNVTTLKNTIEELLGKTTQMSVDLRGRQCAAYPLATERGVALRKLKDAVLQVMS